MERRTFALVGHPVGHSLSPAMHRAAFAALGLPHDYILLDAPDEAALRGALDRVRSGELAGLNVTAPHKQLALRLADARDPSAEEAGATNTLAPAGPPRGDAKGVRLTAYNTDAAGLEAHLRELGVRGRTAAILGSGGAARAALLACRKLGFDRIIVTSRAWGTLEAMSASAAAGWLRARGALAVTWPGAFEPLRRASSSGTLSLQWQALAAGADLLVQATSAAMAGADPGEPLAALVHWASLRRTAVIYDVIYSPAETPFLRAARAAGLVAHNGLGMLLHQAARAVEIWTGRAPDVTSLREAARGRTRDASP